MKRTIVLVACSIIGLSITGAANTAFAKLKINHIDKGYNFEAIDKVAVLPYTSQDVDFGKVSPERLPKIEALLEKCKKEFPTYLFTGAKSPDRLFWPEPQDRKETTVIMKINVDQFDNGSHAARLVPFAGKAKVTLTARLYNAKSDELILDMSSSTKSKASMFVAGGLDSTVLRNATLDANYEIFQRLNKLAQFKKRGKKGGDSLAVMKEHFKGTASVLEEETRELKKNKKE